MKIEKNHSNEKIHPIVLDILKKRKVEDLDDFFSWDLKALPDLESLLDLELAAQRIIKALDNDEEIGVYGDYDVDGTTSCALLFHFFKTLNKKIHLFQPSRFVEGYGIHPSSIDDAMKKDITLLISVDCGISNLETAEYTHDKNIDLIITDHHKDAKEYIPKAYAVINPNRRDEKQDQLKSLAGVGVAFCLALKIKNLLEKRGDVVTSIYPLLEFVSIGTICDLAKLNSMNKKLVRHGLKQLPKTKHPGLRLFLNQDDIKKSILESEKCSFHIGPHINSRGRLEHPQDALHLLINDNPYECDTYFRNIVYSNTQRKKIQNSVYNEAFSQVKESWMEPTPVINIVYASHWHEGVIGIVASKLVETFKVPCIVFTDSETSGIIKASARTAGELDLFQTLDSCSDLFLKFGGHKAAAGLSMKKENLPLLKKKITQIVSKVPAILRTKQQSFDLEVSMHQLDIDLCNSIARMEPFGQGNPYPILRIKDAFISDYKVLKDKHLKWTIQAREKKSNYQKSLYGLSFFYLEQWNKISPEELIRKQKSQELIIDAKLSINHFNGRRSLQLLIENLEIGLSPLAN